MKLMDTSKDKKEKREMEYKFEYKKIIADRSNEEKRKMHGVCRLWSAKK